MDGTGVRVGVISDGIKGVFETGCTTCDTVVGGPISTDDLPIATGTRDGSGILTSVTDGITASSFRSDGDLEGPPPVGCASPSPGRGAEGTALLEIVHDLAPGAQLFFSNFGTSLEFQQAVNFLAANTDVVVDDIGFLGRPNDGTSDVSSNTASALNNTTNPIRAYFTSVGNLARNHYQENFLDSGVEGTSIVGFPGNLHLFQPTTNTSDIFDLGSRIADAAFLRQGATANVVLVWNDSFGASSNDFDLFLVQNSTGIVVAQSIDPQTGTQLPIEFLTFTNDTGSDDFFDIFIQNSENRASGRNLDMFIFQSGCDAAGPTPLAPSQEKHNYNTIRSSVTAQSDAGGTPVSVISVGAIDQADPGNDDIEFFSAVGPSNDGRLKPDVTGIDGVSITGAGDFGNFPPGTFPQIFFGTSAAAPHAAGTAALLLQSAPCLLKEDAGAPNDVEARTTLRNLILNNAVDLGSPGPDNVFGHGRIDALAAVNQTIPEASAGANQTVSGNVPSGASFTLDGTTSSDPNGCPLTFDWMGDCGIRTGAEPQATCPFGTNNVTLTVTNNGVTFPPPAEVQITVTDFMVGASPSTATVSPGQAANYTVTIDPEFGPFSNGVSLACSNLPASTSCSFSRSTVTPRANLATSNLTISTTASSISFKGPLGSQGRELVYALWIGLVGVALLGHAIMRYQQRIRNVGLSLSMGLLLLFLVFHAACRGGAGVDGGQSNTGPGTPSGTFSITITGTSGSLQHSATANLVVE